ncbi:Arm DNA-binding domain-containing protein, partial (plasmid) [Chromobacterium amazonense]
MALTDLAIRQAKPQDKPYQLADGESLYLEVSPSGGKLWRFRFRFQGKA